MSKTEISRTFGFLLLCFAASVPATVRADQESALSFLGQGNASLSFRYRYETVDEDGLPEEAHASTLRTRLNYQTPSERKIGLVLEVDNVLRLGGANFGDGNRAVAGHPVVADPNGTDVNQVYLSFKPMAKNEIRLGRQRINLDDQRFIGGVGWRQNEQTYDAARIQTQAGSAIEIDYAFLWNVNRIFGPEGGAQASDWDCQCHLLNVSAVPWPGAKLAVFGYQLDLEDAPALANRTIGVRLEGSREGDGVPAIDYLLAYASQSDAGDNPVNYSAPYWHARVGFARGGFKGSVGVESLGGDENLASAAFVTPLATLHAFNGWADKFLGTPAAGLQDVYLRLDAPLGEFKATVVYHDYSAEAGSSDYGKEWDLSVGRKFSESLQVLGKLAIFDADSFASDTTKFWVMLSYMP